MDNFIDNLVQRSVDVSSAVTVQPAFAPSFQPDMSVAPGVEIVPFDTAIPERSPIQTDVSVEASEAMGSPRFSPMDPPSQPLAPPRLQPTSEAASVPIPGRESPFALPETPSAAAFSLERADAISQVTTPEELAPLRFPAQDVAKPLATPSDRPVFESSAAEQIPTESAPATNVAVPSPTAVPGNIEVQTVVTSTPIEPAPLAPTLEVSARRSGTPPSVSLPQQALEETTRFDTQVPPAPTRFETPPPSAISAVPEPQVQTVVPPAERGFEPVAERLEPILETPPLPPGLQPSRASVTATPVVDNAARSETPVVWIPYTTVTPVKPPALDAPGPEELTKIEPALPLMTMQSQPTIRPASVPPLRFPAVEGRPASAPQRPAIHIRIGTIEVRATTPPPSPPPPARVPAPLGFSEYVQVRNYMNWGGTEGS